VVSPVSTSGTGINYAATTAIININYQEKRVAPTVALSAFTDFNLYGTGAATVAVTGGSVGVQGKKMAQLLPSVAAGLTANSGGLLWAANTNARIKITAEP
jgi:hypothetical protein